MAVTIDFCGRADIDDVVQFIDDHWARGHALVRSRALLDWQHRNPDGGYSFVVARRDGAVIGILGYISTRRFDPALAGDNVVWLTTWKVRDDSNVAGVGLALLQHLARGEPHAAIGAIGLNPATQPIYRALGYQLGELQHYVLPNAAMTRFALLSSPPRRESRGDAAPLIGRVIADERTIERVAVPTTGGVPRKTPRYFYARYGSHPVYEYTVMALSDGARDVGLIAMRVAEHDGHRAVRVVDSLGHPDFWPRAGAVVQTFVQQHEAEYADIYNAGIDSALFECAGFSRVDPDGPAIVPDHFEPFERRNIRLHFSLKTAGHAFVFKGDADQDRPNAVPAAT
jgi:hypothetical protein